MVIIKENLKLTFVFRETLYMAVNYVDRYLSRQSTPTRKSELQLIGVSALFFAAKLEEIYPPKLAEFAYVTDSACTEMEMREMELMMLKVNLPLPSSNQGSTHRFGAPTPTERCVNPWLKLDSNCTRTPSCTQKYPKFFPNRNF